MQNKKIGLGQYFQKYKFGVTMYVLSNLVAGLCSIFITIYTARAIEIITNLDFAGAINCLLITLGITVFRRLSWWLSGVMYDKYSVKIMADLNTDLAKQSFKLNSQTFASHDSGVFVQRIVSDPEKVVNSLADIVNTIANIVTSLVMIIYIATLNLYVALIIIALVVVSLALEFWRLKCRRKNKSKVREESDKITTLTTEIVRSERDIKSLGLEEELAKETRKFSSSIAELTKSMIELDKLIQQKRKMLLDIEKENIMTIASALRVIPKKPENDSAKETILKVLSGNAD